MEKTREMAYAVMPEIANRKSIRAFDAKPIDDSAMQQLFEAARWSFSAGNQQPWRFVYAHQHQPLFTKIWDALNDGNKPWTAKASALIVVFATKYMANGNPYKFNLHDAGAATMSMALQAIHMGFQLHPMAGYKAAELVANLNVPETLEPVTVIAVGYPSTDLTILSEAHQAAEVTRGERFEQNSLVLNTTF